MGGRIAGKGPRRSRRRKASAGNGALLTESPPPGIWIGTMRDPCGKDEAPDATRDVPVSGAVPD